MHEFVVRNLIKIAWVGTTAVAALTAAVIERIAS